MGDERDTRTLPRHQLELSVAHQLGWIHLKCDDETGVITGLPPAAAGRHHWPGVRQDPDAAMRALHIVCGKVFAKDHHSPGGYEIRITVNAAGEVAVTVLPPIREIYPINSSFHADLGRALESVLYQMCNGGVWPNG